MIPRSKLYNPIEKVLDDMDVNNKIGEANILCAYTRPKLIGGERARYTEED